MILLEAAMKKARNWYGDVSPMTDEDWENYRSFIERRSGWLSCQRV